MKVVDAFGQSATKGATLAVAARPSLSLPPPPAGQVGLAYSDPLTVTGGTGPYVWSVSAGTLPPGLTLDPASGLLAGTPTTVGSFPFTVKVVDSAGQSATQALSVQITAGPLVITKSAERLDGDCRRDRALHPDRGQLLATPFSGVSVSDPLAGVLDDASYGNDAAASAGTVSFASSTLTWTGPVAAGATVTITYSVTVDSPDSGNMLLSNAVTSSTLGTNCPTGTADPRCAVTVPVGALTIVKVADVATASPGNVVHYTITATNSGQAPYPTATITDSLAGVLDDAVYNADAAASAGVVSFSSASLSWTGAVAVGTTVTITYSVTVNSPDTGDRNLGNAAVSTAAGNNCPAGSTDARCHAAVTLRLQAMVVNLTADAAKTTPGAVLGYTLTVTNTGQTPYSATSVSTSLAEVLSHASYNADATTTVGTVAFAGDSVTWSGALAVGATVTVTFSVTVSPTATSSNVLTATASSAAPANNCPTGSTDPRCTARSTVLVPGLTIVKTASSATVVPGSVTTYTITVSNTGQTAYPAASVTDALGGVLDDATYNGDAATTSGSVAFTAPNLTWTGALATGATATITYSVTVLNPATGDRTMTNTVVSTAAGNNCATGGTDARCTATVTVTPPGLALTNQAAVSTTTPGSVIGFTVTISNTGQTTYSPATVTDSLTDVLDDATYNGDATSTAGTVSFASPNLTWTGSLAVGATVTVRFTATVRDPDPGSRTIAATLVSTAAGNNCPSGSTDAACVASVTVLRPGLTLVKTADVATTTPGSAVHYTITVTNAGETSYSGATVTDSLSNVLNDSVYNNDAAATSGVVDFATPVLTWTGDLAVGASATITYSVTVRDPDPGDKTMVDTVVSAAAGNNCAAGSTDARCTAVVLVLVPGLTITTTATTPTTAPGATVHFVTTVSNSGQTAQTNVSVAQSLAGVLDDATYGNDAAAGSGTVTFASPVLTWTGTLAAGASATITFTAVVDDPVAGDLVLTDVASSSAVGSNCPTGGSDSRCSVSVPVARLVIALTTSAATTVPGGVFTVDASYTNTGQVPYTGISVTFTSLGFADDATGNGDQTASSGTLTVGPDGAVWTGDIPVGATITLSGSVIVNDPDTGDRVINGFSSSAAPGNNCPDGSTDPRCSVTVHVLQPALSIVKTADASAVQPGATVGYTVAITNSGETPYTGITVTDPLAGVLDDAEYNSDATATAGSVNFTSPTLTWTGDVAVGVTVTISYSVTVRDPDTGDKTMVNPVTSTVDGSTCTAANRAASCTAVVAILTPGLTVAKSADAQTATPGATVTYTMTISNTGQVPYTGISVLDNLAGLVDDAAYNHDASATAGSVSYAAPVLTWTGNVGVGAVVTLTYTVTVDNPVTGDVRLVNVASSTVSGSNCTAGNTDERCTDTVTVVNATTLTFTKSADVPIAAGGGEVHYTITVANAGLTPYVGATFTDSLSGVIDDASYNGDAAASAGTVGYAAPVLSWTGTVPASGSVTITYSVTVVGPPPGDKVLTNTISSPSANSNCAPNSGDPRCTLVVRIADLGIANTSDVTTTVPGGLVTFTSTFTNEGSAPYFGAVVDLGGGDILDDADPTGVEFVSSGTTVIGPSSLQWTGDIPVGGVVTIRAQFQVHNPDTGNQVLSSTTTSSVLGNDCPVGGTDPDCTVSVNVLTPGLTITKVADTPFAVPGSSVAYTVTIANTGTAPYTAAVVTDTLAGALDDATLNDDATATTGAVSFTAPTLTWTGDLAVGASAVVTYTMTVRSPDPGDKTMVDRLSSTDAGSTCAPASSNAACAVLVPVLTPALSLRVSGSVATVAPGGTVGYTVQIVNTGQTAQFAATVDDSLAGLLDDARYNGDAAASTGTVTFTSPELSWTGTLAPGDSASVTYSITVAAPDTGNHLLVNTLSSAATGNNCAAGSTDPACTDTATVSELTIANTAGSPTTVPGAVVRFTTTVTNTGQTPYTDITISASFVGSLDDGSYNGDAAASTGTLVLVPATGTVRWTGSLNPGQVLTVTGTFTVFDPDPGNKVMTSIVSSAVPGNNCPTGGTDPACTARVDVLVPALTIVKSADTATIVPGGTVSYTITVTNTGQTPYTGATVNDDLTGILGAAAFDDDASTTAGSLSYTAPTLTWTGGLAVGASATITYTITVDAEHVGGRVLANTVTSADPGSTCPVGGATACTATVHVLVPALDISKHADAPSANPGSTVTYTLTVANTGQTDYVGATVTDDLTGVLDDSSYNSDATATSGSVAFTTPTLTWTGDLAIGATAVITYSVTVQDPDRGDLSLVNTAVSDADGSNCLAGSTDPGCTATVAVLVPALSITRSTSGPTTTPGSVVRFSSFFTNTGATDYVGIHVVIRVTDTFDDARSNRDQTASSGTITVNSTVVTWTGDIPVGATITVTGTVTVNQPDTGNRSIANTASTDAPGSNCPTNAPAPACTATVTVLIPGLAIAKTATSSTATPGAAVGYTITATNTGETAYVATSITDDLSDVLVDAAFDDDAAASSGQLSFARPSLTWTGDIGIGASVSITFTVTIGSSRVAGRVLTNTVSSPAQGNNCAAGSPDPQCDAVVAVLIPGLTITKTADTATVTAGQPVSYTVRVVNTGQAPYQGAQFNDPLTGVLDDATYNADAVATTGTASFAGGAVSWVGDLAVGASAVVTYSVTTTFPDAGDHVLTNTVVSDTAGANCAAGATDPRCTASVTVVLPSLQITKTADMSGVVAGGTVHYSLVIVNNGAAPYSAATVTDSLAGVLDDGTYPGDATATSGTVGYSAPALTWTGALAVNATVVVSYTVIVSTVDSGDGQLVNVVTSSTVGSNCPVGGDDPRCTLTLAVAAQSITLSSLSPSFTVAGLPGDESTKDGAVTMTVDTNSPTGYSVTVRAVTNQLAGSTPGNADTIPVDDLGVRESGQGQFQPMSTSPVTVHSQSGPSAPGGDAISNDYQASIPFVTSDTYSATLEYIVTTQ